MRCPYCGMHVESDWDYCPRCGGSLARRSFFEDVFERINREFKEMDKLFDRNFEALDISQFFKDVKPKRSGFSIRITQIGGRKPEISIKTFGDVDKEEIAREIHDKLGIDISFRKRRKIEIPKPSLKGLKEKIKEPKVTEEPKTTIKRTDSKVVVEIEIPDIKNEENIEVRELENSVEVKAIAGDKAYFKILSKPRGFRVSSKKFRNGKLYLEFS